MSVAEVSLRWPKGCPFGLALLAQLIEASLPIPASVPYYPLRDSPHRLLNSFRFVLQVSHTADGMRLTKSPDIRFQVAEGGEAVVRHHLAVRRDAEITRFRIFGFGALREGIGSNESGDDSHFVLWNAKGRRGDTGLLDIDALVDYLKAHSPLDPGPAKRIVVEK